MSLLKRGQLRGLESTYIFQIFIKKNIKQVLNTAQKESMKDNLQFCTFTCFQNGKTTFGVYKDYFGVVITILGMPAEKSSTKKRVKSVLVSAQKPKIKQNGTKRSDHSTAKPKKKRERRFCSVKVQHNSQQTDNISKEEPLEHSSVKAVKEEQASVEIIEQKSNNPHFMTVADLTSGDFVQAASSSEQRLLTPINQYHEQSTIKAEPSPSNLSQLSPLQKEKEKRLDQTIGKLKSKQQTIDILNKTIQTRLVEASPLRLTASNKMDIYEVEMNYYVERITALQKELHEKNKMLAGMAEKNAEFNNLLKNNRKLLGENHRLREERHLLERENQALKKIVMKKTMRAKE